MYNVTLTRVRVTFLSWKAIIITYSEGLFLLAVGTQHTMHTCVIILSSVACLALTHFSTLSHNRQEFWKTSYLKNIVWFFSVIFVCNIYHYENNSVRHYHKFDVCVTVHHWYNNINSQLDATVRDFIDNYNQLSMFRAIISLILRSTRLCLQLVV